MCVLNNIRTAIPVVVVVVVVVVDDAILQAECLCRQVLSMKLCRSPRWQRTLRHRGLRKLALNSGTTWRSAKNDLQSRKTPHRRHNRHCQKLRTCLCCTTGMSTDSSDELDLRHLYRWRDPNLSLHDHRTSITAESTCGTNTTCTTGTSAT